MAKVTIEYDTVEKSLAVSVGGQPLDNVQCVDFYKSYDNDGDDDSYRLNICTATSDEDEDVRHVYRMSASESAEGKKSETPATHEGFQVTTPVAPAPEAAKPSVTSQIQDYLTKE